MNAPPNTGHRLPRSVRARRAPSCGVATRARARAALVFALAASVASLSTTEAIAQGGDEVSKEDLARAEAKAMEAKFKFKAGEHEAAAKLFLEAFAISRRPALVYNAARAFEDAGRFKEAKVAFETYLGLPDVSEAGRDDARAHIKALEARIAAAERAAAAAAVEAPPGSGGGAGAGGAATTKGAGTPEPTPPGSQAPAGSTTSADAATAETTTTAAPAPAGEKTWLSWVLVGGGGLLSLAALASYGGAVGRVEAANTMDFSVPDAKAKYSAEIEAATSARNGAVFFGLVGVGLAAWGGYRLLASPSKPTSAALWGAPTLGAPDGGEGAGLVLGGSF